LIISCGEALIDFLPAGFGAELGYLPRAGGAPFNLAVALARLAVPSGYLGCIAEDPFGDKLVTTLHDNRVSDRYVVRRDAPTTLAFVNLVALGSPEFAFYNRGAADTLLQPADLPAQFDDDVSVLAFGSYALAAEPVGSTLLGLMQREVGKRCLVLDPNVRLHVLPDRSAYRNRLEAAVRCADLVKCSRRDIATLYPDEAYERVAQRWLALGAKIVIVTLKEQGAALFRGDGLVLNEPGMSVTVVDAIGAGDSFLAALLALLQRQNALQGEALLQLSAAALQEALHYANRAAAIACSRSGGTDPPALLDLVG
jgi:fructokinase